MSSYLLRVAREAPFEEVTFRLKLKDKKGTDENGGGGGVEWCARRSSRSRVRQVQRPEGKNGFGKVLNIEMSLSH